MHATSFDTENEMFQLAVQLANQTRRNIFLTGKAGTGKTTFLKHIRANCQKQTAIVAPTGVAAINAGGVTIHSFFQLPFSPFIPVHETPHVETVEKQGINKHDLISRLRFNTDKKKLLKELELLIIDEISMVRCDLLDAIDVVLRYVRNENHLQFGGVQVLFIGDMLQLPPVAKDSDWQVLSEHYQSPFFFDSKVIKEQMPLYIEFTKIYRQKDDRFISVLNQVRNNKLDEEGRRILNSRVCTDFQRHSQDGYIVLTTHNHKANLINNAALGSIDSDVYTYEAHIEDEFSENAFPVEKTLQLKVGAQVMFTRNDTAEKGRRYFNGKIGIVNKLGPEEIHVQCDDGPIKVNKDKWENIRYKLDRKTRKIDSEVLGSFTQFPLRLAWAITIHKSQGLTFDKAIIDAGDAFAPGQVYVALSRCSSLEGMVLQTHIKDPSLTSDLRIANFSKDFFSEERLKDELQLAKAEYERSILFSCFDFTTALKNLSELLAHLTEQRSGYTAEAFTWTETILHKTQLLQETAVKFKHHIGALITENSISSSAAQERIQRAALYFSGELEKVIFLFKECPVATDSYIHARASNDLIREVYSNLALTLYILMGFDQGFDLSVYQSRRRSYTEPAISWNTYGMNTGKSEIEHPELYRQLKKLRDAICSRHDMPIYLVASTNTLIDLVNYLPQDKEQLKEVSGFGKAKTEKFGQQFLDIIKTYSNEKGLSSLIHQKSPKRVRKESSTAARKKGSTYAITFKLFKEGQTIDEIAKARKLAPQTIQTHLERFIRSGEISIEGLVEKDKIAVIREGLNNYSGTSLTELKQNLEESITYGEIRLVMAFLGIEPYHRAEYTRDNN